MSRPSPHLIPARAYRLTATCYLNMLCLGAALCCWDVIAEPALAASTEQQPRDASEANDAAFHARLLEIARDYKGWEIADATLRLAPTLCRAPLPQDYNVPVRVSASDDDDTHGRKLYYLFTSHAPLYRDLPASGAAPVGFSIVKESWEAATPPPEDEAKPDLKTDAKGRRYLQHTQQGAQRYHVGEKHALFVMYKLDPSTPNTDRGWVYGTVTADGQAVTSAGRVGSCMSCHAAAPHGGLFGLK